MDVEEEINIVEDVSNSLVSHNSGLGNCDSQWLLDRPKPSSWYINSLYKTLEKTQEELPESVGHITSENSISDESGWTGKEKHLLERGIEIFGKSVVRLAQFIGSKSPSEIKYYLETFYTELHPLHSAKYAMPKADEGNDVLETVLLDSEIPCTSEPISQKSSFANCKENDSVNNKNACIKVKMKSSVHKRCRDGEWNLIYNNFNDITVKSRNSVSKTKFVRTELSPVNNVMPIRTSILLNESEEIIKIKKKLSESSDSDIEVDVENNDEVKINDRMLEKDAFPESSHDQNRNTEQKTVENLTHNNSESVCIPPEIIKYLRVVSSDVLLPEVNQELMDQLSSLNIPKNELKLRMDLILDVEKVFNRDFFSVSIRSVKSPELYLRLRHEIISKWMKRKPHYVTKTDVGKNLNLSINKNTLNRIHNCLEQIGAINFGCSRVRYVRPLYKLMKSNEIPNQMKSIPRRNRKKFLNNGQGGCTVSHGDHGEIINTTIVNEDPAPVKMKMARKQPVYLIYCKSFTQDYEYSVKLHISTLLLMDFHAHSSLSEVMGLIGGNWCAQTKTLSISHYEPCKNVASSTTHCDMCPVSQANSAEIIHNKNMDLLGWFHSHPTFAPEPSQQDLDTQKALQEWIGRGKPCVGVILSPFNKPQVLSPSEYRCMIVEKLQGDDVYLPYKFKVEIQCENFDIEEFLGNVLKIFLFSNSSSDLENDKHVEIIFKQPYLYDENITYFDKFISSTKITLERYFSNNSICQKIISGIQKVCNNEKIF